MELLNTMVSNTLAGSTSQTFFIPPDGSVAYTGRVFYKVFAGGTYMYSFAFSAITDSSFPEGNDTPRNTPIVGWEIISARVGICSACNMQEFSEISDFQPLYFDGRVGKKIEKAELFCSDEVLLSADKDEYICLEITYRGEKAPHHWENTIPAFLWDGEKWQPSNHTVFACKVGCQRAVKKKIAFLGDSITQGIGPKANSYRHWNAVLAEKLGEAYAYWNLGIGYAMANDAATDGKWLYKAKQNDVVFVCFGVNDIFRITDEETTQKDLFTIIQKLKEAGCQVILQTIPPFSFEEERLTLWKNLNEYIKTELVKYVDLLLDIAPVLGEDGMAKYELHPNETGCLAWVEYIYPKVKEFLDDNA